MKILERHIFPLLIAGLFIVSSAGVYLTVHYCSSEDLTDIFLFTAVTGETCEHHTNDRELLQCCDLSHESDKDLINKICWQHPLNESDHCKGPEDFAECCSNTVLYITVEDEYLKTEKPALQVNVNMLLPVFGNDLIHDGSNSENFSKKLPKDHPPGKYGKELLHLNRILLL